MTTNHTTNHQIMKMKTEVSRLKIAKETKHLVQPAIFKECLQQHRQIFPSFNLKTFSKQP